MNIQTIQPQNAEVPNVKPDGGVTPESLIGDNEVDSHPCPEEQWPIVPHMHNSNEHIENKLL